jgi:protein gp37
MGEIGYDSNRSKKSNSRWIYHYLDWARSLRDQCQAANVPFFFKQWGEWGLHGMRPAAKRIVFHDGWPVMSKIGKKAAGRLLDGKEWNEFPNFKH